MTDTTVAGYDWQTCLKTLTQKGYVPVCEQLPSAPYHCDELINLNPMLHQRCAEAGLMYWPIDTPACVQFAPDQKTIIAYKYFPQKDAVSGCFKLGPPWTLISCWCCCSCLAYGTLVATVDGPRAVETIATGDEILGGWRAGDGDTAIEWRPVSVTFSDGAASQVSHATVYLTFGSDEEPTGELICTGDQPVMLADGSLAIAKLLRQGEELMGQDGNPVRLRSVAIGEYSGGIHHVGTGARATSEDGTAIVDGHLVVAAGIVVGDYFLQIYFPAVGRMHKAADLDDREELGTPEYEQRHAGVKASAAVLFGAAPQGGERRFPTQAGHFRFYTGTSDVPAEHADFFTPEQARDVLENGEQMSFSNPMPKALVESIFKGLRGFYPDLTFYVDWNTLTPNVYAIEQYGQDIVVVTGGLARLVGLGYEGLAMMIAHGIARFSRLPPRTRGGLTATGPADYFGFGLVSRTLWNARGWIPQGLAALAQIEAVFALVNADHAVGEPGNPDDPSLPCRLEAMRSGFGGAALPECAGGPPEPKLTLQTVTPTATGADVVLGIPPTPETATDVANYTIVVAGGTDDVPIVSAKLDPRTSVLVMLEAELAASTDYELTIHGLESIVGTGVDPAHDRATFKTGS